MPELTDTSGVAVGSGDGMEIQKIGYVYAYVYVNEYMEGIRIGTAGGVNGMGRVR